MGIAISNVKLVGITTPSELFHNRRIPRLANFKNSKMWGEISLLMMMKVFKLKKLTLKVSTKTSRIRTKITPLKLQK